MITKRLSFIIIVLLLCIASRTYEQSFVGSVDTQGTSASGTTLTLSGNPGAGHSLAIECCSEVTGASSITDSHSDTWAVPICFIQGSNEAMCISWAANVIGGSTTFTVNGFTSTGSRVCTIAEYKDASVLTFDNSVSNGSSAATNISTGTVTANNAPHLDLGGACLGIVTGATTGPNNGFSALPSVATGGDGRSLFPSYRISSINPGINTNWTTASSTAYGAEMVVLDLAGTPTATPSPIATATPTAAPTSTQSSTPTSTSSNTPLPTATSTSAPTQTSTIGPTGSPTNTPIPQPTPKLATSVFGNMITQGYSQLLPYHLNQAPGAPINGQFFFCDNCLGSSTPCTTGGSGSIATYLNGQWNCDSTSSLNAQGDLILNSTNAIGIQDITPGLETWQFVPFGAPNTTPKVYITSNPIVPGDNTKGIQAQFGAVALDVTKTVIICDSKDATGGARHANTCYMNPTGGPVFIDKIATTVALLNSGSPCTSTLEGARASVTDATAATAVFGTVLVGGSNVHTGAYCNGTNWIAQ